MAITLVEGNKYSRTRLTLAEQKRSKSRRMPPKAPGMGMAGMKMVKKITAAQMAKMGC